MNPIANRICLIIANKQNLRFCFLTEKHVSLPVCPPHLSITPLINNIFKKVSINEVLYRVHFGSL